ncbi:cysteine methyltransferase [Tumebacillus algifaecis]|uniref:methylated-DNA--[protein]-cysteine S-methyltransferase n=1 Tax=Tumebacillus algifaecis TaxID=1214604 RepID=A0A223CY17_9BACL|nr:methylated-DNA--[protein]-cysteine S-methyltransferase [Tumebacillus algifaecis]ASS74228.1 cysteine methyltransferase [Tumebacillus algifaecis]
MEATSDAIVYWSLLVYDQWRLYLAATSKGLCYVGSSQKPFEELSRFVARRMPQYRLVQDEAILQPYADELVEFLQGKRLRLDQPFDCHGTPFQRAVWNALCEIPYGQTRSYSELAEHIHKPSAVRAVGTAIGANPLLLAIPCHRVIGKNGALTGYRGGIEMKKQLLQLEHDALSHDRLAWQV